MNQTYALALSPNLVPGSNFEAYTSQVNQIPVLDAEQEQALAERLFFNGDLEAARQLVLAHLRFVVYVARGYAGYGLNQADLVQEGNIGLMKAVKRFDPRVGVRLISFAVHWIKAEIHDFVLRNWRIVRIATTKAQRKLFFNLRGRKKRLTNLTEAEMCAIATDLKVSVADVREMEGRLASSDYAFDAPAGDSEEGQAIAPVHFLEDANSDPAIQVEQEIATEFETHYLAQALAGLDERSQDILRLRWLAEKKSTLHELAAKYSVSAERIRQLERNAMKHLKVAIELQAGTGTA